MINRNEIDITLCVLLITVRRGPHSRNEYVLPGQQIEL